MVWRTAQRLQAALAGRPLTVGDLRWPTLATLDLTGQTVLEVVSAGKHLLTRLDGGLTVHSHLRMEGSWRVHASATLSRRTLEAQTIRAVLGTTDWTAVGHRLGMLDVVPTGQEDALVGHLGPDLLGPGWDPLAAVERIRAAPQRPIGEALLDQRVLAGAGTFYMCESLFLRGVTPWTPVQEAGDLAALIALLHRLILANRDRAVQVTTGDARPGRQQWVHARSGTPCRRCGTTVRVARIGQPPTDRVAFYCPSCQRGPAPTDDGLHQRPLGSLASPPSGRGRPGVAGPPRRRPVA